jgi:hypothetical protein
MICAVGTPLDLFDWDTKSDGPQEARTGQEESLPVLHQGGMPAAGIRRLQGRADTEEAVY